MVTLFKWNSMIYQIHLTGFDAQILYLILH